MNLSNLVLGLTQREGSENDKNVYIFNTSEQSFVGTIRIERIEEHTARTLFRFDQDYRIFRAKFLEVRYPELYAAVLNEPYSRDVMRDILSKLAEDKEQAYHAGVQP